MLRQVAAFLPQTLRQSRCTLASQIRCFSADLPNVDDPVVLKKFVGVEENLGSYSDARGTLRDTMQQLLDAISALPESSGYRQAVDATMQYRLKVLDENESNQAVEEVLDAHMEELILETEEELKLIPEIVGLKPYDVPADHTVPVFDYHYASEILGKK